MQAQLSEAVAGVRREAFAVVAALLDPDIEKLPRPRRQRPNRTTAG